jgi:hypothetical protein
MSLRTVAAGAAIVTAAATAAFVPGTANAAGPGSGGSSSAYLNQVSATSADNAWAVGSTDVENGTDLPLVLHWNGRTWAKTALPSPPKDMRFYVGAADSSSPDNAWVVGNVDCTRSCDGAYPLMLHWNGQKWSQTPGSGPAVPGGTLASVTAISSTDAWAVGSTCGSTGCDPLIMHWNGEKWSRIASPGKYESEELYSVTATSAGNVWASGMYCEGDFCPAAGIVLHWNGKKWQQATLPDVGFGGRLKSITAISASNVWAVGDTGPTTATSTLIMHWNGKTWARAASPNPTAWDQLQGVAATSPASAWAVGSACVSGCQEVHALVLRWNGKTWSQVKDAVGGSQVILWGVAATSVRNAWAVGQSFANATGTVQDPLIVHWNGKTWVKA